MIIVSDSSPIMNLACIDRLYILPAIYKEIIIPKTVFKEIVELGEGKPGSESVKNANWIVVKNCSQFEMMHELEKELDSGEAEAISLAIELGAEVLLIDEYKGRNIARKNGVRVLGLLGVLIEAKKRLIIDSVKQEIDKLLVDANFWISNELYSEVLKSVNEIL